MVKRYIAYTTFYCIICGVYSTTNKISMIEHLKICERNKKKNICSECEGRADAFKKTKKNLCWACFNSYFN